jgi:SAM-dependent methyltransferase
MPSSSDLDPVRNQYENWVFPEPIPDLSVPGLPRDSGDPLYLGPSYWPADPYRDGLQILVAGCGANAAARYAFNNPKSEVLGIDLSDSSLAHANHLKSKHGLENLVLKRTDLTDIGKLGRTFDLIDCTGVLHHMAEPLAGLRSLAGVLRPDGVIFLMLYGKYGRTGIYMLQELFRRLKLAQTAEGVHIVRKTIAALPADHPARHYLSTAPDIGFDGGLVDTFLHPQDRAYTVAECLDLLRDAGLVLLGWKDNILYHPSAGIDSKAPLVELLNSLPDAELWQAMELINGTIAQHSLYACRADQEISGRRISFEDDGFMRWIPLQRKDTHYQLAQGAVHMKRSGYSRGVTVAGPLGAVLAQADGKRSIDECFAASQLASESRAATVATCRTLFRDLWRLGHYHFVLRPA